MPSCSASSFSHGDAFISSKPERTTTCTSSPPRRRALRQQSIAVLPPPSTTTRLPIFVDVSERHGRQPVDADVDVLRGFAAARDVEVATARRAAADEHRVEALGEQRLHAVDSCPAGTRCPGRGRSPSPRRSRRRAGGTSGSACASCRRPARRRRTRRSRSRAARDRARRSATPGPRRRARCACRSWSRPAWAGARGCLP